MRNLLDRLLNTVRNILSFADPRYQQHFDWDPTHGGGGGSYTAGDGIDITSNTIRAKVDGNTIQFNTNGQMVASVEGGVTKEYVDNADQNLQDQIDGIKNGATIDSFSDVEAEIASIDADMELKADKATTLAGYGITDAYTKAETDTLLDDKADKATTLSGYGITDAYTKTETNTELDKKLDKRTTGVEVYSHSEGTQGAMTVKTAMSDSPTDTNILTEKAVKTYVDGKDPLAWNYVGMLNASAGSTLTVKDDWKELLIVGRLQENSYYYNDGKVIPKVVFTQGAPTNNNVFVGFYWNDNYTYKARIGLYGSGNSRYIKNDYPRSDMWVIAGFYIFKR